MTTKLINQIKEPGAPGSAFVWPNLGPTSVTILQSQVSVQNKDANLGHLHPSNSGEQQVPRLRRSSTPTSAKAALVGDPGYAAPLGMTTKLMTTEDDNQIDDNQIDDNQTDDNQI